MQVLLPVWHSWLLYIPLSYSLQHGSLCCPGTRSFCSAERTCIWVLLEINNKYSPQYFHEHQWMWADPWNESDTLQKWDWRTQHDRGTTLRNPWILVPGTCHLGLKHNQHCWSASHVGMMEDPFNHWASLTNSIWQLKGRRYSSTLQEYFLFLCQRLRNCMCISSNLAECPCHFYILGSVLSLKQARLTSPLVTAWDLAK